MSLTAAQLKKYPDGLAEVQIIRDLRPSSELGKQFDDVPRVASISLKIPVYKGIDPYTKAPHYDEDVYEILDGARTNNCGAASLEHQPEEILEALLKHQGHKDQWGNIKSFDVVPIADLIAIEQESLEESPEEAELVGSTKSNVVGAVLRQTVTRNPGIAAPPPVELDKPAKRVAKKPATKKAAPKEPIAKKAVAKKPTVKKAVPAAIPPDTNVPHPISVEEMEEELVED